MFLQTVSIYLQVYMVLQPKRPGRTEENHKTSTLYLVYNLNPGPPEYKAAVPATWP